MNGQIDQPEHAVPTTELQANLERVLVESFSAPRRVTEFNRRPSQFRSSYPLEELDIRLDDGTELPLIFKDMSFQALPESVRRTKPEFLYNPLREIDVYRSILAGLRLGTATCYGAVVDAEADRYWLFLERVPGLELYRVGELVDWQQAARWLARLHSQFAGEAESLASQPHLLRFDRKSCGRWMRRATKFERSAQRCASSADRQSFQNIVKCYDRVVRRLAALPVTLIHGEFYASNVLVQGSGNAARICPIDWEMAAVGPGLIDLAALTAGAWSDGEREALTHAYHDELRQGGALTMSFEALLESLDDCRLHMAVQWLGWSAEWTPPHEHQQDWRAEALRLSAKSK